MHYRFPITLALGAAAVFVQLSLAPAQPEITQGEKKKGQPIPAGSWAYLSNTYGDDKPLPQAALEKIWLEITDKSFIRCGDSGLRSESRLACYPDRNPMEFDLEFTNKVTKKVSVSKGIYKVDGDRITICYDNTGKSRPTDFKTRQGESEYFLSVLRRKK
jgi:uncharacterized protein (TIGR03067 family)